MDPIDSFETPPSRPRKRAQPKEYKVVALRECPVPEALMLCDTPEKVVEYWNTHLKGHPYICADRECLVVLLLNTRRRVKGHHLVSIGTIDTILVHAREVYRTAIVANAAAVGGRALPP